MTPTKLCDVYELQQRPRLPNDFTWTPAGRLREGQVVKRLDYFLITCIGRNPKVRVDQVWFDRPHPIATTRGETASRLTSVES
jgi:hypothetical protein